MCLSNVDFTMEKSSRGEWYGVGYKNIPRYNGKFAVSYNRFQFKKGIWLKDPNRKLIAGPNTYNFETEKYEPRQDYAPGFHILLTKKDCEDYNRVSKDTFLVHFKEIVCFGKQDEYPCVIARQLKIVKEV